MYIHIPYMHTYVHTHTYIYTHTYIRTYIHIHIHTYVHIDIYTYSLLRIRTISRPYRFVRKECVSKLSDYQNVSLDLVQLGIFLFRVEKEKGYGREQDGRGGGIDIFVE